MHWVAEDLVYYRGLKTYQFIGSRWHQFIVEVACTASLISTRGRRVGQAGRNDSRICHAIRWRGGKLSRPVPPCPGMGDAVGKELDDLLLHVMSWAPNLGPSTPSLVLVPFEVLYIGMAYSGYIRIP